MVDSNLDIQGKINREAGFGGVRMKEGERPLILNECISSNTYLHQKFLGQLRKVNETRRGESTGQRCSNKVFK
jgi:hypothetical protein